MRALQKIKNPETLVWLGLGLWWIVNLVQAGAPSWPMTKPIITCSRDDSPGAISTIRP